MYAGDWDVVCMKQVSVLRIKINVCSLTWCCHPRGDSVRETGTAAHFRKMRGAVCVQTRRLVYHGTLERTCLLHWVLTLGRSTKRAAVIFTSDGLDTTIIVNEVVTLNHSFLWQTQLITTSLHIRVVCGRLGCRVCHGIEVAL